MGKVRTPATSFLPEAGQRTHSSQRTMTSDVSTTSCEENPPPKPLWLRNLPTSKGTMEEEEWSRVLTHQGCPQSHLKLTPSSLCFTCLSLPSSVSPQCVEPYGFWGQPPHLSALSLTGYVTTQSL